MSERKLLVTRVVSVIAATVIALACGTNVSTPHGDTRYPCVGIDQLHSMRIRRGVLNSQSG